MKQALNRILIDWQGCKHTVAISTSETKNASDFIEDCSSLISSLKGKEEEECILSCKNSYYFAVSFFSLLHEGKKICLPPGMERGSIEELRENRIIISDFYEGALNPKQIQCSKIPKLKLIEDGQISLFTSGSTGERKEIHKSLAHFSAEVKVLESSWKLAENSLAISSVSHQHIYGLLFKILWPMASKRPFYIEECLYEDQLNATFKKHKSSHFISCPAHLDAIIKFPSTEFIKNKSIFSSGAPLSFDTAKAIKKFSTSSPIEVFGSTETGGIAWRQQTESSQWSTLKEVNIKADEEGTLFVKSPYTETANEWYETGDKVEILSDSCFKHLGRKGRIAKVSGKRLSLTEMEQKLTCSELISSCKVLVLEEQNHTQRDSTALIAILTEIGESLLKEIGRRKFSLKLKSMLKEHYPAVVIPRYWRYIEKFPTNAQGKSPKELLKLFFTGFDEKEVRFPELLLLKVDHDKAILKFKVPEKCSFFDGHFADKPILPGVAQLFWVQFYTEKFFGVSIISEIKKLKFQRVIQPGEVCELTLLNKDSKIDFKYNVDEQICSSGCIAYE